jgi:hypothetical protein
MESSKGIKKNTYPFKPRVMGLVKGQDRNVSMKIPTHKIDAIKIVRDIPFHVVEAVSNYGFPIQRVTSNVSLLEAKLFIEAVMALGKAEAEKSIDGTNWKERYDTLQNQFDALYTEKLNIESKYWALRDQLHDILNK